MRTAPLLVLLMVGSACIPIALGEPEWVASRRPLPACGTERLGPEGGFDLAARRCTLAAWESGAEAELITAMTSVEGDLVTRYLRVHADGSIELFVDATQDAYGSGRWERFRCEAIMPAADAGMGDADRIVFVEVGCEPVAVP